MRGTEPGSLIKEPARGSHSSEPWRLGVGPEVISLEIGGQQSRIVSGQFTHALLPPQRGRNLHPGQLRDSNASHATNLLVAILIRIKLHKR